MTTEQEKTYSTYREFGYDYEYTDADGRIHMNKYEDIWDSRRVLARITIDLSGDLIK